MSTGLLNVFETVSPLMIHSLPQTNEVKSAKEDAIMGFLSVVHMILCIVKNLRDIIKDIKNNRPSSKR